MTPGEGLIAKDLQVFKHGERNSGVFCSPSIIDDVCVPFEQKWK